VAGALRRDLRRYAPGARFPSIAALLHHGAWASIGYRFAVAVERLPGPDVVRMLGRGVAKVLQLVMRTISNVDIPPAARIGPGLHIAHTGYVVVASGAIVGENCTLTPGVVLGHALGGEHSRAGAPRLGDRVYVGPGAKIIGPIDVGDDALVGVGAVVTRSVPPRGVVLGNPGRVVGTSGAFDVLSYPGMETDPARRESIAQIGEASA
jgi:serine O-acetyltransferase